jgi:hypothetical protein
MFHVERGSGMQGSPGRCSTWNIGIGGTAVRSEGMRALRIEIGRLPKTLRPTLMDRWRERISTSDGVPAAFVFHVERIRFFDEGPCSTWNIELQTELAGG